MIRQELHRDRIEQRRDEGVATRDLDAVGQAKTLPGVDVKVGALALIRQTPETNPRMAQRYSDGGISAPPEVWKGIQYVSCVGKDMTGLQGSLTELQKQGAILTEMHFDLTPETWATTRKALAGEALSALRAEALQVADAMGMQIDRYLAIQINEENDQRQLQQRQVRFQDNGGALALPSSDIEVSVTAGVNVKIAPKPNPQRSSSRRLCCARASGRSLPS